MVIQPDIFQVQTSEQRGRVIDAPSCHWVYRFLPQALWPYAQLARWDRPVGWKLLLWPCWWSLAFVTVAGMTAQSLLPSLLPLLWYLVLFLIGAVAMRGAGCTYNDLVDHRLDSNVERTTSRPLPAGQVTRRQAWGFILVQSLAGLMVLLQFNGLTIVLGFASLGIVALYPFMKRVTDWPQLFLGLAFNWGALLGWTAVSNTIGWPPVLLYIGAVLWTIGYDTIYAHQDRKDDALIGIRSTARLFGKRTKPALSLLYAAMLALTAAAFYLAQVPALAYSGLILAGMHMLYQIRVLDIEDGDECLRLFKASSHIGWLIFAGLVAAGLFRAMP